MSIEKIVRPFQTEEVFTLRRTPSRGPEAFVDAAVIVLTGPADTVYVSDPHPYIHGLRSTQDEDGDQRQTEKVRIENPDDPEQYVMVRRIKAMTLRDDQTGENFNMRFAKWDEERS